MRWIIKHGKGRQACLEVREDQDRHLDHGVPSSTVILDKAQCLLTVRPKVTTLALAFLLSELELEALE